MTVYEIMALLTPQERKHVSPENVAAVLRVLHEASAESVCGNCAGTGRMVRDPDIGTDQECFACDGTGRFKD
jgi:DnaJ-class molecular chaperone